MQILWIHGFPLSSAVFERQRAIEVAEHVMPDLPGFGNAPPPEGAMSMDDYARFALDRVRDDKVILAGFSMGGYICFAAMRMVPDRVAGLILIDTRETADNDEAKRGRFATIERVEREGIAPVVESMAPKMLTSNAPPADHDRVREIMGTSSARGVTAALRAMAERPDSAPLLPLIDVPALIVVGDEDTITPPSDAERMARAIRQSKLVKIPRAAHLSNFEQSEVFNAAVTAFVTRF